MNEGIEPASIRLAKLVRSSNPLHVLTNVWVDVTVWAEMQQTAREVLEEWNQK